MPWQKMLFRNDVVWVHVGEDGRPILDRDGRAEMKYRENDTKVYRPGPANLSRAAETPFKSESARGPTAVRKTVSRPGIDSGARGAGTREPMLDIWTDGACSGNPGPMGIGVVLIDGDDREEIGDYLGIGTNNIAELTAIERALDAAIPRLATTARRVRIHSDSSYAIGLLEKGWKAKANQELIVRIRGRLATFPAAVQFVKVAGHAGIPENERCDELARMAITRRGPVG